MTHVRSRSMVTPVGEGNGNAAGDRISGLNDDLLVRILDLLPDTREAVRTHALSRRWCGLWTGATALRFDSEYYTSLICKDAGVAERYLDFVNHALALRANAATRRRYAVKDLAILFNIFAQEKQDLVPPLFKAAQGWIRYAVQNEVKSLILKLRLPWRFKSEHPVMAIDDLGSSAKLETLHLRLGYAQLGQFSTLVFASLTHLSLGDIMVEARILHRLISSSCCPRLRKLHLSNLHFSSAMKELMLVADALLELSIEMMDELQSLELRTPSLRVLHVEDLRGLERFKVVSAPRLEDLMFLVQRHLDIDDVHGHMLSVATLNIELSSHVYIDDDENDASFEILKCCRLTRSLEVSIEVVETKRRTGHMIKSRIPPIPHVTSLTLDVTLWEPHFFGSSIGKFLAQCSSIRYLRLQLCYCLMKKDLLEQEDFLCEDSCQWKSHEFSLGHLQETEFEKLIGTDCELQFIQSILKRATGVQRVAISFDQDKWIKDNKDAFNLMPPLDGGSWITCNNADLSYKWRRHSDLQ